MYMINNWQNNTSKFTVKVSKFIDLSDLAGHEDIAGEVIRRFISIMSKCEWLF
jgi:hypothetical protein